MRQALPLALVLTLSCAAPAAPDEGPRLVARSEAGQIHAWSSARAIGVSRKLRGGSLVLFTERSSGAMRILAESGTWAIPTARLSFSMVRIVGVLAAGDLVYVASWQSGRIFDEAPREPDPASGSYTLLAFRVSDGGRAAGLTLSGLVKGFARPSLLPPESSGPGVLRLAPGGVELFGLRLVSKSGALEASPAATWIELEQIGFHNTQGGPTRELSAAEVSGTFDAKGALAPALLAKLPPAAIPPLVARFRREDQLQAPKDATPRVEVARFCATHALLEVREPLGSNRWHHYFAIRATYLVPRSQALDARFGLAALDARFTLRVEGIGHGSSAAALTKALGEPSAAKTSQSPSLRWAYYADRDLAVTIHNERVYELTRGKPAWVGSK